MSPNVLPTGDWHIGMGDRVTAYNVRSQEHDEHLEVLAANCLKIVYAGNGPAPNTVLDLRKSAGATAPTVYDK